MRGIHDRESTVRSVIATLAALTIVALALTGCSANEDATGAAPVRFEGGVMVSETGMTLYTFDKDPVGGGESACTGSCAANWPPLTAGAADQAAQPFSIITRDDGSRQWAYEGNPLYLWINDQMPGDMSGDNVGNAWHVVRQGTATRPAVSDPSGY